MITISKTQKFARKTPNLNGKFSIVAKNRKFNGISALKNKTPTIIKIQIIKIKANNKIKSIQIKNNNSNKHSNDKNEKKCKWQNIGKNKQLFNTVNRN